jgi:hypothetical protein
MLRGMRTSLKFALITVAAGVPAFFLTPILFPTNPKIAPPGPELIPYFLTLAVIESLFFGIGVAFLALGFPMMRRVASISGVSPWPAYLAIGYLTASWWPHLGMHGVAGMDFDKLILVDYGFHVPYILAAGAVAHFFFRTLEAATKRNERTVTARAAASRLAA